MHEFYAKFILVVGKRAPVNKSAFMTRRKMIWSWTFIFIWKSYKDLGQLSLPTKEKQLPYPLRTAIWNHCLLAQKSLTIKDIS